MLLKLLPCFALVLLTVGGAPLVSAAGAAPAGAQSRVRTPYADVAQGRILPFADIKSRVDRVVGGRMIGMEYDADFFRYLLRYERGSEILDVVVDARTGRILNGRERM